MKTSHRTTVRALASAIMLGVAAEAAIAQQAQSNGQPAPTTGPTTRADVYKGTAPAAPKPEWADEIKQPTEWFKWGADLRVRDEYFNNAITLNSDAAGHEWHFQRYRARVWDTITPIKSIDLNTRLMWEGRHWCKPDSREEWDNSNILFDNLNVKVTRPGDLPITATAGRQDIILGDGWLVLEGTPLDGSRTIFFDAARATLHLDDAKTNIDLVYIDQSADPNRFLSPIGNDDFPQMEQDERGAIVYATNKSLDKTQIDVYGMYKHNDRVLPNGDEGEIYTAGGRVAKTFTDNLSARIESAYQWGDRNDADLSAWGANSRVTYAFNDPLKNQVWVSYEFLSGDDPDTSTNEQWVPLWARWPQFSELIVYTYLTETRIAEVTNLHRIGPGWQIELSPKLQLVSNYYLLWADESYEARPGFSSDETFRGQLLTSILRYRHNRFVSGHLIGEYFMPDDFYADPRDDDAAYLRAEVVLTF